MATITDIARIVDTRATTTALALGGTQIATGHAGGISAVIEAADLRFEVTRLEGETGWTIDAATNLRNGFPLWRNGEGARYLRTRQIADEATIAQLDAAAAGL